jgi:hypothetical protein
LVWQKLHSLSHLVAQLARAWSLLRELQKIGKCVSSALGHFSKIGRFSSLFTFLYFPAK